MAKNKFDNELMLGMQRELQPVVKKAGMDNLVKAADYLHAAIEIFEEAGLTAKADQVLRILGKIASQDEAPAKDQDFYSKVMNWIDNPATPVDSNDPQPGEELSFTSIIDEEDEPEELEFTSLLNNKSVEPSEDDLLFRSVASELGLIDNNDARRNPKNTTKVSDSHSKAFDFDALMSDDALSDLLDADIMEESLEVSENELEKTFEDSD